MKMVQFSGEISEYQGKALDKPIPFSGEYEAFENIAEVRDAGEWPNDGAILKSVNTKRLTAAKQKLYQEKTAALKQAYESTPEFRWKALTSQIKLANPDFSDEQVKAAGLTIMPAMKGKV